MDERFLAQIAGVAELFWEWSYDPASDGLAVFADEGDPTIHVIDATDGTVRTKVAVPAGWPKHVALSPQGRWLAFHSVGEEDGHAGHRIYLAALAAGASTAEPRLLVETNHAEDLGQLVFSPSGDRLVYEVLRKDKARGNALRIVELPSLRDRILRDGIQGGRGPGWSADGKLVYYAAGPCLEAVAADTAGPAGGAPQRIACFDRPISGRGAPDRPTISPDGKTLALTIESRDCLRLVLVDLATGTPRDVDANECGMRPTWLPGPKPALAFIGLDGAASRVPRVRELDAPRSRGLGIDAGVAGGLAIDRQGRILALLSTLKMPRSVFRIDPKTASASVVYSFVPAALAAELGQRAVLPVRAHVRSTDDVEVPLLVFPPSAPAGRVPVIVFLHGGDHGREDISPRWWDLAQYYPTAGIGLVAVNYRGSTGYGNAYRDRSDDDAGKVNDVGAAYDYVTKLPWADPDRIVLFAVCSGADIGARLVAEGHRRFRAVIQWFETAAPWTAIAALPSRPPLLWITGTNETGSARFPPTRDQLMGKGLDVTWETVKGTHHVRPLASRVRAAELGLRFIRERTR